MLHIKGKEKLTKKGEVFFFFLFNHEFTQKIKIIVCYVLHKIRNEENKFKFLAFVGIDFWLK